MDEPTIDRLQRTDIHEVAGILTGAFKTNPAYSIIFKKKEQREEGLFWLFRTNLLILNQKQVLTRVARERNTGRIIGTYTLIPPEGVKRPLSVYTKIGLPSFISRFGMNPLTRMLSLDSYNRKLLAESIRIPEYHYLSMVVIKKEYRGAGVGTYVLKKAIQRLIDSNPTCRTVGLTTQLPENVTFYSRLGFDKLDEGYASFKGDEYFNCNMKLDLI
ncbi:MAG: GNAT family N-acetyltransferase [Mediterranea sp.]|jgi:predicted GNAT family N-acyltransferase|nr:GNAT family N-acetyltransferase [Mediterranea sp.]